MNTRPNNVLWLCDEIESFFSRFFVFNSKMKKKIALDCSNKDRPIYIYSTYLNNNSKRKKKQIKLIDWYGDRDYKSYKCSKLFDVVCILFIYLIRVVAFLLEFIFCICLMPKSGCFNKAISCAHFWYDFECPCPQDLMWQIAIYCCYRNSIHFKRQSKPSASSLSDEYSQAAGRQHRTRIVWKFVQNFYQFM